MWGRRLVGITLAAAIALGPAAAAAHADLDAAREHYDRAEFTEALEALDRAERSAGLTDEELHGLLALRATIHFATRAADPMREALRTLASIAPGHRFDPALPPVFLEAWARARRETEPLRVRVVLIEQEGAARFEARVEGSGRRLVDGGPTIHARAGGEPWRRGSGGILVLEHEGGGVLEYYAEAIGPGGLVVARQGRRDDPLAVWLGAPAPEQPREIDWLPWIVAGAAGAIAVGLAIALGVVASR